MIVALEPSYSRTADWRRFGTLVMAFGLALAFLALPDLAMAQSGGSGGGFNGNFGPNSSLVTNTDTSLLGWWKAIASWLLWVAIAGFLVSIVFAGGRWWWIPVAVFLVCLFGENAVNQVKSWAGF